MHVFKHWPHGYGPYAVPIRRDAQAVLRLWLQVSLRRVGIWLLRRPGHPRPGAWVDDGNLRDLTYEDPERFPAGLDQTEHRLVIP